MIDPKLLLGSLADVLFLFNMDGVTEHVERFDVSPHLDGGAWVLAITDDDGCEHRWRLEYEGYEETRPDRAEPPNGAIVELLAGELEGTLWKRRDSPADPWAVIKCNWEGPDDRAANWAWLLDACGGGFRVIPGGQP